MSRAKFTFIVAFIALLLVPLVDTIHPFIWEPSLTENRLPAKVPDFAAIFYGDGRLSVDFGKWFDDRMRPRSLLIELKNQIDYWLFRYSSKIFVGREGWLFQPDYFNVNAERLGDKGLKPTQQYFLTLASYLASRDTRLIIIANPIKETIYPQLLPDDVPKLPADTIFQKMRRFLKSHQEWIYIDDQDVLTKDCPGVVVFNHTDIHPTFPGGVCMARELVRRVAATEGWSQSPWDHHFTLATDTSTSGGQSNFMALLFPIAEEHYVGGAFEVGKSTDEGDFVQDPHGLFEWAFHTRQPYRASKLPALVLFGDSFLDHYASAGVFTYFTDVYRVVDNHRNLGPLLRKLPPGTCYFVYEFIEPNMEGLTPFDVSKE